LRLNFYCFKDDSAGTVKYSYAIEYLEKAFIIDSSVYVIGFQEDAEYLYTYRNKEPHTKIFHFGEEEYNLIHGKLTFSQLKSYFESQDSID
jgi:hypothetical protein